MVKVFLFHQTNILLGCVKSSLPMGSHLSIWLNILDKRSIIENLNKSNSYCSPDNTIQCGTRQTIHFKLADRYI